MRDIFPPNNKRSIRNVTPPRTEDSKTEGTSPFHEKIRDVKTPSENEEKVFKKVSYGPGSDRPNGGKKKWLWWISGFVLFFTVLLVIGFGISSQFATAKIVLKPKSLESDVDMSITAKRSPSSGELGFEVMSVYLNQPKETPIEISGSREVEERAGGMITIYNEFNTSEQILVENTRFESPEGYIFRIRESVTVPGMSGSEPGTLRVQVFADEPGENYNISPTRFTIPGFHGSPRFAGFYARSESPMEGGFVGTVPIIEEDDLEDARNKLREGLKEELLTMVNINVPDGFVLLEGAYSIKESFETKESEEASLVLNAHLIGAVFKKEDLARYLFKKVSEEDGAVEIDSWDDLNFIFEKEISEDDEELPFSVSGNVLFFHKIDKEKLVSDITGISRNDSQKIEEILNEYPTEGSTKVIISPSWTLSIPSDPDRIDVEIIH